MRALPLLVTLVLLPLVPSASAHIEDFSQAQSFVVGPYLVYLEPQPATVYANSTITFSAQIATAEDGRLVTRVPATLALSGPQAYAHTVELEHDGRGYLVGAATLPGSGNYTASVLLRDDAGEYENATSFLAYPDLPVRLRSADAEQDISPGARATLTFETLDALTLMRADKVEDLTVRVEHWSDDHKTLLASEEVTLARSGVGLWKADHVFPDPGMYHLRFASRSGGFNYDDIPILHLYARQVEVDEERSETPVPWSVALVALGVVALALRRR